MRWITGGWLYVAAPSAPISECCPDLVPESLTGSLTDTQYKVPRTVLSSVRETSVASSHRKRQILLLISLVRLYIQDYYTEIFSGNPLTDPLIGALAGSIYFGSPITSYIVGGELLADGVSLMAITAFIMAWTTVGIAMLPLEAKFLGKKFSIIRNITNFFSSVIVAVLTVYTLNLF